MTTSPPPRRFLPEPVETTIRTSKRPIPSAHTSKATSPTSNDSLTGMSEQSTMSAVSQPRRFRPEPIEETTRSSRKPKVQQEVEHVEHGLLGQASSIDPAEPGHPTTQPPEKKPRRFAPEPVDTSSRTSRKKFAPEPVETSTRSSKDGAVRAQNKTRRFAPEPLETSARTRKNGKEDGADVSSPKPRRKFAPEPISTEKQSRRRSSRAAVDSSEDSPNQSRSSSYSNQSTNGTRRFSPELIETAKGTYRRSAINSPASSVGTLTPPKDEEESEESEDDVGSLTESRFSAAALAKRNHEEQRRRSFAVPDLPMIESDSGDDSSAPSLTNSRSSAESDQNRKQSRHPADASYTDYVLRLARQTATDKDIIDQAMAAYINEVPHQAPAHYGFDDDDEAGKIGRFEGKAGADVRTFRRQSQDDLDWELQAMQRHHAQLEEAKRQLKHDTAGPSRFSAAALATRHKLEAEKESKSKKVKAEESELAKMRAAASPPMLGDDLIFPQTISPKMTRCETDQHPRPRFDDSDEEEEEIGQQALWNTTVKVAPTPPSSGGLWGGCCNGDSLPGTPKRTGLQTPAAEKDNPFETSTPGRKTPGSKTPRRRIFGMNLLPLTPQRTNEEDAFTSSVDKKLQLERQIEEEFPDRVVTQIYNYLSLGYPALAWSFDEELAKISRISLEDLRKDDERVNAKGYVDAPEGEGCREEDVANGGCRRWEALRLYVREWARQSPNFVLEGSIGGVGMGRGAEGWGGNVGVRRGSWGL